MDDHFHEGLGEEVSKLHFDQLTTSDELHYIAVHHNWDDGVILLQWIAESKLCSQATALMIFWLAQPQDYLNIKWNEHPADQCGDRIFQLIKVILENYQNHFYQETDIHFDPNVYVKTGQQVPDFMMQSTQGEESYIYYDEKEVNSWFGEYLDNQISRCKTALELFNIASFVKSPDTAKLILKNPLCDKGIAVMLFWRLKTYAKIWFEADIIANEIINKIQNNEYPEVLSYNPKKDKTVNLKVPKPKWTIPEVMKKAI